MLLWAKPSWADGPPLQPLGQLPDLPSRRASPGGRVLGPQARRAGYGPTPAPRHPSQGSLEKARRRTSPTLALGVAGHGTALAPQTHPRPLTPGGRGHGAQRTGARGQASRGSHAGSSPSTSWPGRRTPPLTKWRQERHTEAAAEVAQATHQRLHCQTFGMRLGESEHVSASHLHREGCRLTMRPQRGQDVGREGGLLSCYAAFMLEYTNLPPNRRQSRTKEQAQFLKMQNQPSVRENARWC